MQCILNLGYNSHPGWPGGRFNKKDGQIFMLKSMLTNMELHHGIWLAGRFAPSQSEAMTQFHVNMDFNMEIPK